MNDSKQATKDFHIGDILSVTTGKLVSPRHIDGVYDVLGWMTGESLMTHQLPRVSDECAPSLRDQHPDLAEVEVPETAEIGAQFGEHHPVAKLAAGDHTSIDPIAEIKMMRPDLPVIVVESP